MGSVIGALAYSTASADLAFVSGTVQKSKTASHFLNYSDNFTPHCRLLVHVVPVRGLW